MLNQTVDLDRLFHALADSSRRSMVDRLSRGAVSVSDLAVPLAMSLSAVVQHVNVLEECGLVSTVKVGRVRMCRIEPDALQQVEGWVADRRRGWERRFDRLEDLLAADPTLPSVGDAREPYPDESGNHNV